MSRFRGALAEVLTPEQRKELRDSMKALREERPERPRRNAGPRSEAGERPGPGARPPRGAGGFGRPATRPGDDRPSRFESRLQDQVDRDQLVAVPTDLPLLTATGRETTLAQSLAEHRPTIVLLGSYSAPSFRERMADLPWLVDQLRTPSGRSADLVVVYTRERHPSDGWTNPKNDEAGIAIPAHTSAEDRLEAAKRVRSELPDRTGVSLLVDTMDDRLASLVAGDEAGDHVVVLRPDGTVSARQRWFDPTAIVGLVEAAAE